VSETLAALQIEQILVIGGTAAVSPAVVQFHADRGDEMERLAGANGTETAPRRARPVPPATSSSRRRCRPLRHADADGDGFADGSGETNTGARAVHDAAACPSRPLSW
jgi:hypothetical protein